MAAVSNVVWFTGDFTSSKFNVKGYENKTVVVMGHLTLPKNSVFKVATLVVLGGKLSLSGKACLHVTGKIYNAGTISHTGSTPEEILTIATYAKVDKGLKQQEVEELDKLGIHLSLQGKKIVVLNAPAEDA